MINIYDYETLSTASNAVVINVSALSVDENKFLSDTPYTFMELVDLAKTMKFDVKEQVEKFGRVVNPETLNWWRETGPEARKQLTPQASDVSLQQLPTFLREVFALGELVFSRGGMDIAITTSICDRLGEPEPNPFWDVRDTRSFIEGIIIGCGCDLGHTFVPENVNSDDFVKHNSSHDIAIDVCRIQQLVQLSGSNV